MRVYLAGPIFQSEDSECIDWREEAKQLLDGHETIDPMDRDYRGVTDKFFKEIVEEDKALIDSCDILLVNYIKPSVGTSMEILYAWERKICAVVVSENSENSPWLIYHSHEIFSSLKKAVEYIRMFKS